MGEESGMAFSHLYVLVCKRETHSSLGQCSKLELMPTVGNIEQKYCVSSSVMLFAALG